MQELAPDADDRTQQQLNLLETCTALRDKGHPDVRPDQIENCCVTSRAMVVILKGGLAT